MSKTSTFPATYSVGLTAKQIAGSSHRRKAITISAPTAGMLYVAFGRTATTGNGWPIPAKTVGRTFTELEAGNQITDYVSAILVATDPEFAAVNTDTDVTADSGDLAATAGTATLPGVAGQTTYISGFSVTGTGATAGSTIRITITGLITGTMGYDLVIPAGAAAGITPLVIEFNRPIPASAVNTAIVVNMPSFGAGNLHQEVNAHGFQRLTTAAGPTSPADVGVLDVLYCECPDGKEY